MLIWIALFIGLVTGICSGFLGIGGGMIVVPLLVLWLKYPEHTAQGTSLVALLLPVGTLGAWQYYQAGKISAEHIKFGLWIAVGIFIGTYLGSKIAVSLPEHLLRKTFALLLLLLALRMWWHS